MSYNAKILKQTVHLVKPQFEDTFNRVIGPYDNRNRYLKPSPPQAKFTKVQAAKEEADAHRRYIRNLHESNLHRCYQGALKALVDDHGVESKDPVFVSLSTSGESTRAPTRSSNSSPLEREDR